MPATALATASVMRLPDICGKFNKEKISKVAALVRQCETFSVNM